MEIQNVLEVLDALDRMSRTIDRIQKRFDVLSDEYKRVVRENKSLHQLLDLRDEQYFEFCETGIVPMGDSED